MQYENIVKLFYVLIANDMQSSFLLRNSFLDFNAATIQMHFKTFIVVHNRYSYCLYSKPAYRVNYISRVLKNVIQNFLIYMLDKSDCYFMFNDQFYVFFFLGGGGGFGI